MLSEADMDVVKGCCRLTAFNVVNLTLPSDLRTEFYTAPLPLYEDSEFVV